MTPGAVLLVSHCTPSHPLSQSLLAQWEPLGEACERSGVRFPGPTPCFNFFFTGKSLLEARMFIDLKVQNMLCT